MIRYDLWYESRRTVCWHSHQMTQCRKSAAHFRPIVFAYVTTKQRLFVKKNSADLAKCVVLNKFIKISKRIWNKQALNRLTSRSKYYSVTCRFEKAPCGNSTHVVLKHVLLHRYQYTGKHTRIIVERVGGIMLRKSGWLNVHDGMTAASNYSFTVTETRVISRPVT